MQMHAQISIITVLLHVSHHLLNPEDGALGEFKDEGIYSKKRRFNKPKPDMIVIRYSAQQNHAGDSQGNQDSSPKLHNTKTHNVWFDSDLIFTQN